MKKILNSKIFMLLLGMFIIVGFEALADTTLIEGSKISYSNSSSGLSSTNMQSAMDELYALARHTTTYTLNANERIKDFGTYHHYKKVDATNVYNKGYLDGQAAGKTNHTATYTLAATEITKDLTADHIYRYIDATNVYNKGVEDGQKTKVQNLNVVDVWDKKNISENNEFTESYTIPYDGTIRLQWWLYYVRYYGGIEPWVKINGTQIGGRDGSGTYSVKAGDVITAYQGAALVGDPDTGGYLRLTYIY